MATFYYRNLLSKKEQRVYDLIREWFIEGIDDLHDSREFRSKDLDNFSIETIISIAYDVMDDDPGLICLRHVKGWYGIGLFLIPGEEDTINVSFHHNVKDVSFAYSTEDRLRISKEVNEWARAVADTLSGSTVDKITSLVGRLSNDYSFVDTAPAHDVAGVLNKSIVCEGLALAFKLVCDLSGIQCLVVRGQAKADKDKWDGHAWNVVMVGDKYYHVDATWAMSKTVSNPRGLLGNSMDKFFTYGYILMSDDDVREHHKWDRKIPKCFDQSLEYYRRNDWIVTFNKDFTLCYNSKQDMQKMTRVKMGQYGPVYVTRARLVNENGNIPKEEDILSITLTIITRLLDINDLENNWYDYDPNSGNYMIVYRDNTVETNNDCDRTIRVV